MPVLEWSDTLVIDNGVMDGVHHEFLAVLNRMAEAEGEGLIPAIDAFIAHTEDHFAQEERWMEATGFPPMHCHYNQHQGVLEVARDVRKLAKNDPRYGRLLAEAVAQWFADHVATQDTWLAQFMVQEGYDPKLLDDPKAVPAKQADCEPAAACGSC